MAPQSKSTHHQVQPSKGFAMKRILLTSFLLSAIFTSTSSYALGWFSRSCLAAGAQESITLEYSFNWQTMWTASSHYKNGAFLHTINTVGKGDNGWEYSWRSYAGHIASEFWYGQVIGYHYTRDKNGAIKFLGNSVANDCNISQWGF